MGSSLLVLVELGVVEQAHVGHLEEYVEAVGFEAADFAALGVGGPCLHCCCCWVEAYALHSGQVAAGFAAELGFEAVAASDQLGMAVLVLGLVDFEVDLDH
jgi:hypothetical protein